MNGKACSLNFLEKNKTMTISKENLINTTVYLSILLLPLSWIQYKDVGSIFRFSLPAMVFITIFLKKKVSFSKDDLSFFYLWLVFFFSQMISVVWSKHLEQARTIFFSSIIVFLFLLLCFFSKKIDSKFLKDTWLLTSYILLAFFIFGSNVTFGYHERKTIILFGTTTDPNEFAFMFVLSYPFLFEKLLSTSRILQRLFLLTIIILFYYIVFMTGSRGALFSIVFESLVLVLFGGHLRFSYILILFLLFFLIYIFFSYIIPLIPESTLDRITLSAIREDEGSGRVDMWKQAINSFTHSSGFEILFGCGSGGTVVYNFGHPTTTLHNTFLQLLADYGMINFIFFLILSFRLLKKAISTDLFFTCSLLGCFIQSFTLTLSFIYKPFWFALIAFSFAVLDHNDKSETIKS